MNRANPKMRDLAERLVAYETSGNESAETRSPAAFRVCEKLRPPLATLMGDAGFRALLSRALALATAEVPWLAVQVRTDGSLEELEDPQAHPDPDTLFEGRIVLPAQLLGLLVGFIGERLTWRLVREVWPQVPVNASYLVNRDRTKKTKVVA